MLSRQGVWSALTSAVACGGGSDNSPTLMTTGPAIPPVQLLFFNNIFSNCVGVRVHAPVYVYGGQGVLCCFYRAISPALPFASFSNLFRIMIL